MTNVMILISTLSIFHSFRAISHLALHTVLIFSSWQDARCCSYYDDLGYRHKLLGDRLLSQGYEMKCLRNSLKNFTADWEVSEVGERYGSLTSLMQWYNWFWVFLFSLNFITDFVTFYQLMLVVMGVMHEADNAYSIRSTWLCYRLVRFLTTAYICL